VAYDFEADDGGFVPGFSGFPGPGDWEWGVPIFPAGLGATSGANVWATILDGPHNNNNGSSLLTKTVDLTGFNDSAQLLWSHYLQANNSGFDFATINVNGDEVFSSFGNTDTPDWTTQSVPVSAYVGGSAEIVFDFFATAGTNDFGWYIDDVVIASCTPPDTPVFDNSSKTAPDTVSSNDAYTYTVSINNTGASATNVIMTDPIPAGTTYVPGSATNGATYNGGLNQIEWTGDVANATTVDVSFMVTATLSSGVVTNTAVISHSQIMTPVIVTATTNVVAAPSIVVAPGSLSSSQAPGTQVTQTLTISNVGSADLDWDIVEQDSAANFDSTVGADARQVTDPADAGNMQMDTAVPGDASTAPAAPGSFGPTYAPQGLVLYDNGPLVNSPGTGAGGADESVLQTTSLGMNTLGFGNHLSALNRVADDFIIPAGNTWTLDQITFFGYQTGSPTVSTYTAVNLRIWDGEPGNGGTIIWGDTTTNVLISSTWTGMYRVTETTTGTAVDRPIMANVVDLGGLVLPAGTYWLDWQSDGTLASGPWAPPITINGVPVTGNGLGTGDNGTTWAPTNDSGTGTPRQGLPFIIEGTPGCAASDIPWASASPNSGTTASGAATDVTVTFDSTGLSAGVYDGTLCVTSNDPANPLVEVPLTLTVEEGNIAPVAVPDTYTTDQDTVLNVAAPGVLGNDSDADSDPLTAVLDLTTSNGTLNLNADGSFTYTPDPGFSGADGFTYHANDGTADSNIVTVTINVVETEYVLYLPVVRKAETTQAQPEAGTQTSATEDRATVSLAAFPMALGMWVLYRRKDGFDI
jgi:uncharacterized repeat protein (TIGR01451 family)